MDPRRRARALALLVGSVGVACLPSPKGTTIEAGETDFGSTSAAGVTTGGPMSGGGGTGEPPSTTGEPDGEDTACEPHEPVCSAVLVTPGGALGCGGEELSIAGCDQLAGYEVCPNRAIHRHTAGVPCGDDGLCDPWSSCSTDEDCDDGFACVCNVTRGDGTAGPFGRSSSCVWAECRTDADCAFGMRCGVDTQCGIALGLFCHTPEDGCEGDADCPEHCGYSYQDRRWFCVEYWFCD